MRCIAANRSILTVIDQNATLTNDYCTAMTSDINSMDIIQFADGWYSYPDLNTFDSDLLLDVLTIRNIKSSKAISPWNSKIENPTTIPLTDIATRQLEALFNLSQLLFGLARDEQLNYTFRDLQLGQPARKFNETGFNKFPNNTKSIFQLLINDILKSDAIDIVFMMYKDPRLRCVKQKSLDFLTNICTINELGYFILNHYSKFFLQLIQGIRDGNLIEEKIPSLSILLILCKIIIEKNLMKFYQYLIDMQFIDILIDIFQNQQYKTNHFIIYLIKFELFAFQCLYILLQSIEYVDMWSEKAQIRLINYCCTLLYKSILNNNNNCSREMEINHIIYAEKYGIVHSLSYGILTFLNVIHCRKEIEKFYRGNEHFRELLNAMKDKYSSNSIITNAINQVNYIMFNKQQRKKQKQYRKCSNNLCQMIENDQAQFEDSPPVLCVIDRFSEISSSHYQDNKTTSISHNSVFETLPIQMSQPIIETTTTADIPNDLCYPSSCLSSSTDKKKSLKTFLSLLRVSKKRH